MVAIPGTKRVCFPEENVAAVDGSLTVEVLGAIESAAPREAVVGERYGDMSGIDA